MEPEVKTAEHWFYHLERSSLEAALLPLLEKIRQRGWRAFIRSADQDALAELDRVLWTYKPDGFLPHGLSTQPHAADQPVLLSESADNENAAQIVILVHGAADMDLQGVERCITMFDGKDEQKLAQARARWKTVNGQGASASYWRQDENGRWNKQN